MLRTFCFILLLALVAPVHAQEDRAAPPPPLPEDPAEELPEPEVKIIHREDRIVEEVSVNGRLRYVKITPRGGVPYYIVDTDGDGILDQQFNNLENPPINQWILLRW
ncbi:MAG: DUF2782 domain-containing protein [Gammaproteobacteria bacterium]|nr:DUF2782 domain-containing protein [Gammaproteobacteria bacterium]